MTYSPRTKSSELGFPELGSFPAEVEVLLGCVKRTITPEVLAKVGRVLRSGIDWTLLLQVAHRHSVLPILHRQLRAHFWAEVPVDVQKALDAACRWSQQRNLALLAELIRTLESFEAAGVSAIPFKGPALSVAAYGAPALRSFCDLDILVHENDLDKSRKLLIASGYVPTLNLRGTEERAYRKEECALQFRHPGRDAIIELHWRLTERYLSVDLPIEVLWQRSRRFSLAGRPILSFSNDDLLLYLCIHAGKHKWERLEWLSSIASIMEADSGLSWVEIEERARRWGLTRLMNVTLLLLNCLLQVPIPAPYRDAAADSAAGLIAREVASTLFDDRESVLHDRANWYFFWLATRERWRDKARVVVFSSFRIPYPETRELIDVPPQLAFLQYTLRPVRLLYSALSRGWRRTNGQIRARENKPIRVSGA